MKDIRVARRYAAALFGIARRDDILDSVAHDLTLISRFVAEVPYLRAVLMQPLVSDARKNKVVDDAFGDRVTATSLSFLKLLIRKRREDLIDECVREFRLLVSQHYNMVEATVYTAVPLTDVQSEALSRNLERMTGKTVLLEKALDPAIMGGVIVRLGDTVIDGSVRGRLQRLEQQLLGAQSLGGMA